MDEQTLEQVIDTWNIHNRIHKYLLDAAESRISSPTR